MINLIDLVISFMNIIYLTFENENENLLDTFYLKLMYHFSDKYKVGIILQKFIFYFRYKPFLNSEFQFCRSFRN